MDIVFFGSSHFAVPSLEALIRAGRRVVCVVTQPDRKKGRGMALSATPVKEYALKEGLRIYQPDSLADHQTLLFLKERAADVFVVIAYGLILPEEILCLPRMLALNLHASLLPRYRGAAPINRALIRGENSTGVTVIKMNSRMDAGPILMQQEFPIGEKDTYPTLEEKLSVDGGVILLKALEKVESGSYTLTEQNESEATFAPKMKKSDGRINWENTAEEIYNLVRGCVPWPGAFTSYKRKMLKLCRVRKHELNLSQAPLGSVIEIAPEYLAVACKGGSIAIEMLQPEGARIMSAADFIHGHKIRTGERFS